MSVSSIDRMAGERVTELAPTQGAPKHAKGAKMHRMRSRDRSISTASRSL
jgi:hypothetical protein